MYWASQLRLDSFNSTVIKNDNHLPPLSNKVPELVMWLRSGWDCIAAKFDLSILQLLPRREISRQQQKKRIWKGGENCRDRKKNGKEGSYRTEQLYGTEFILSNLEDKNSSWPKRVFHWQARVSCHTRATTICWPKQWLDIFCIS